MPHRPIRVAVNGFGRIGRIFSRIALEDPAIQIVAVNDLAEARMLAHLLKYDSTHGLSHRKIDAKDHTISVDGHTIEAFCEADPSRLPWESLEIDCVVEATGVFIDRPDTEKHLRSGASRVLISAPAKKPDLTLVMGVNHTKYNPIQHHIVSNASCTTNCLAPIAYVLHQRLGISRGWMTTVHAYTQDQRLIDAPHRDPRRARAAALSVVPTTTGAAKALSEVIPELAGKIDGIAIRVPTPNVSLIDLSVLLESDTDARQVNALLAESAGGTLRGILEYSEAPLVSIDLNGNPHSAIIDGTLTAMSGPRLLKIFAWYDNEWGYASRLRDAIRYMHTGQMPDGGP